jgi:diguanylate cyclase (GGDEF)-like protein
LAIVTPFLAAYYVTTSTYDPLLWSLDMGMGWVMAILAAISIIISYSQLRMLVQLVGFSSYDHLTDCLGRRSGEEIVKTLWYYSTRRKSNLAVAFIDLDHFKAVNDSFGHQIGDSVLADTAATIKRSLRKSDFVIRWGGEEFLVILPDASIENATLVVKRMAKMGFCIRPDGSPQTVSIGIAERINDNTDDKNTLIDIADSRLYQAKVSGRCRAVGTETTILFG